MPTTRTIFSMWWVRVTRHRLPATMLAPRDPGGSAVLAFPAAWSCEAWRRHRWHRRVHRTYILGAKAVCSDAARFCLGDVLPNMNYRRAHTAVAAGRFAVSRPHSSRADPDWIARNPIDSAASSKFGLEVIPGTPFYNRARPATSQNPDAPCLPPTRRVRAIRDRFSPHASHLHYFRRRVVAALTAFLLSADWDHSSRPGQVRPHAALPSRPVGYP